MPRNRIHALLRTRVEAMMFRTALFFAILLCLFRPLSAGARIWTDRTGRQQVEADFVDANGEQVWLKPPDAPAFRVPIRSLSQADQEYVRQLLREENAARRTRPDDPTSIHYGPGRQVATLACRKLDELSGMACSRHHAGLFWAHNDSGMDARVFLFDGKGRDLGSCRLAGAMAYDWEDIASFTDGGKHYLLVADTGNNGLAAAVHMLYLIEEPPCDPHRGVLVQEIPVLRTLYFSFEDDHRNCEAMAVDPTDKTILLVSKERAATCHAYALPWPKDDAAVKPNAAPQRALVARWIGTLELRQVTGMDVSPDGRRAIVVTYGNAFEYVREEKEDWRKAFTRPPREIPCPVRLQGESICYGPDGKTLYLSSEQRPTPLIEIPVLARR